MISGIGLLPLSGWMPWADKNDANQARKLLGAASGSSVASASCPHVVGGFASMQAPECILELIGGIGLLPLFGWRPWADERDENQACKLPVASASCPSVVGGPGPMGMMRIRHANSWGHPRAHRLRRPRTPRWSEASSR